MSKDVIFSDEMYEFYSDYTFTCSTWEEDEFAQWKINGRYIDWRKTGVEKWVSWLPIGNIRNEVRDGLDRVINKAFEDALLTDDLTI